jgi:hypothetical protein
MKHKKSSSTIDLTHMNQPFVKKEKGNMQRSHIDKHCELINPN